MWSDHHSTLNDHSPMNLVSNDLAKTNQNTVCSLTILQILGSVTQQNDPTLIAVGRLVENIHLELGQFGHGLLKHLTQALDRHLQILLIVLENLREIVARQVECKCIRPLQRLAALLKSLRGGVKELHFNPGQTRRGLQAGHLLLGLEVKVLVQFSGLLVVRIPIVVVQVALQRGTRFGLRTTRLRAGLLLISVAVVPAGAVLGPETHAHPAELVLALAACHMVAAAVLLNC